MPNGVRAKEKSKTLSRIYRVAAILSVLMLASCAVQSAVLGRYSVKADPVSDSARVAAFSVSAAVPETQGELNITELDKTEKTSGTDNYLLTVTNSSEVAVSYKITVTVTETAAGDGEDSKPNAAPFAEQQGSATDSLTAVIYPVGSDGTADTEKPVNGTASQDGTALTFTSDDWVYAAGEESDKQYQLSFTYSNAGTYKTGKYTFSAGVEFEQID